MKKEIEQELKNLAVEFKGNFETCLATSRERALESIIGLPSDREKKQREAKEYFTAGAAWEDAYRRLISIIGPP